MAKKLLYYGDQVEIKKGIYKGRKGTVQQNMPNGLIGVFILGGKYLYYKSSDLKLISTIFKR